MSLTKDYHEIFAPLETHFGQNPPRPRSRVLRDSIYSVFAPLDRFFGIDTSLPCSDTQNLPAAALPPLNTKLDDIWTGPNSGVPSYHTYPSATSSYLPHQIFDFDFGFDNESSIVGKRLSVAQPPTVQKRGWRFLGTFGCLALLNFICAIDATILSVALPTIATSIHASAIEAFWCGTSFLLCSTVFQPTWASFSHIIGRRSVLLSALFLFTLGTVICSAAQDVALLLVGRCVQGVGGGGLVALTYVILTDMVTLRERGKWMAIISLQWAIGSVIGPVIGGAFAESEWRWIFWINIPFCILAAVAIPICLRLKIKEGSIWTRMKAFEWFGSFLFVAALTYQLSYPGYLGRYNVQMPSVSPLVAFLIYTICLSSEPLIRRTLFNSPTAKNAYFGTVVHGMVVWSLLYYMPLYYEATKNFSPIHAGIAIFLNTMTTALAAVIVGIIITKTGRYRPSLWIGWFMTTVGLGLFILFKRDTSTPVWVCISLVSGIGLGIIFSAQGFAAQASASNADLPFAGAMYSFFRSLGQILGAAISGIIFQNILKNKLANSLYASHADEWSKNATGLVEVIKS